MKTRRWPRLLVALGLLVALLVAVVLLVAPSRRNYYGQRRDIVERFDVAYADDAATQPKHRLDLYLPRERTRAPVAIFVHGGLWKELDRRFAQPFTGLYGAVGVALARQGFVTAVIGYRQDAQSGLRGGLDDIALAVRFVATEAESWGGDPDRIFIVGHSGGALLASQLLAPGRLAERERARIRGLALLSGAYDLEALLPTLGLDDRAALTKMIGPEGTAAWSTEKAAMPAIPTLLMVGADDIPTLVDSQRRLARAWASHPALRVVELPGAGHMSILLDLGRTDDPVAPAIAALARP